MNFSLKMLVQAMDAEIYAPLNEPGDLQGVSTDSRRIQPGNIFIALRGDRFDGHRHWEEARDAGARVVVMERAPDVAPADVGVGIALVRDTVSALGALALAWRRAVNPSVVAITGSLGKTTTKELVGAIFSASGSPSHRTQGNYNNQIGLPLSVLSMPADTRYLALELGMNAPGEITQLAAIAEPDVAVITNIAAVHLAGLGSLEAIAAAKAELFTVVDRLANGGCGAEREQTKDKPNHRTVVFPAQEALLAPSLRSLAPTVQRLPFGRSGDVAAGGVAIETVHSRGARGLEVILCCAGRHYRIMSPLLGVHHAQNIAAAAAAALALDMPMEAIVQGLSAPVELVHRGTQHCIGPWQVIDDAYNASPASMRAAAALAVDLAPGKRAYLVLGEMLELGEQATLEHRNLGRDLARLDLGGLIAVKEGAREIAEGARLGGMAAAAIEYCEDAEAAASAIADRVPAESLIVFKGSRGARMEDVVAALRREWEGRTRASRSSK